jgi:UDP-glucose 4-epimerase
MLSPVCFALQHPTLKTGKQEPTVLKPSGPHSPEDDSSKTLLVTGAAGYIGSHFVYKALEETPYTIVAVDDESSGKPAAIKTLQTAFPGRVKYFNVAVSDKRLATIMKTFKVDGVVHYAGKISVKESEENPIKYWQGNTAETINLLASMQEAGVKNLVFSSTAATYGEPKRLPIKETDPKEPVNTYGRSKLMVEHILEDVHNHKNPEGKPLLNYIALRYFNVIGAHPKGLLGENHADEDLPGRGHIVPAFLRRLFKQQPIQVFGGDYPTRDGTCVRDYVDVNDLADAHLLAVNKLLAPETTDLGEAINLGSGVGVSNLELMNGLKQVVETQQPGTLVETGIADRRPGDPAELTADNTKAKQLLGWAPKTSLLASLTSAFHWEKNNRQYPIEAVEGSTLSLTA